MNKKIYVPNRDELYEMQDMGANIYNYLLVKVIEILILNGLNSDDKFILESAYKYFRNDPEIAYPICMMYPNEIIYSDIARSDSSLCCDILDKENNTSIYRLDNIVYFDQNSVVNPILYEKIIIILANELKNTPQYRFEYKSFAYLQDSTVIYNKILDDIFSTKYMPNEFYLKIISDNIKKLLIGIEPAYVLKFESEFFNSESFKMSKEEALIRGINQYVSRYGVSNYSNMEYKNKDILTKPDDKTKRLIRCIEKNSKLIY